MTVRTPPTPLSQRSPRGPERLVGWRAQWRIWTRLPAIVLWMLGGLITVLATFWFLPLSGRGYLIRGFGRGILAILGVRREISREREAQLVSTPAPALLVGNHISWLDIYVIQATLPATFIAKEEISKWPVIGFLVRLVGTIFINRSSRRAMAGVIAQAKQKFRQGAHIMFFPEGTTSDGQGLKPFYSSLFVLAERAESAGGDVPVVPITLRYRQQGAPTIATAYIGDMTLLGSIVQILRHPGLSAAVLIHPPLPSGLPRQALCDAARTAIASGLEGQLLHQPSILQADRTEVAAPDTSRV